MTHPAANECDVRSCPFDRRGLLLAAGLAATATVTLAGCGSDSSGGAAEAAPPKKDTGGGLPAGDGVPAGALTLVSKVPVGGGVAVDDGKVVVVQPTGGTFKAYDASCTHKGVKLPAPGSDGVIQCPAHNAKFRAADGSVVKGPAEKALSAIPVKVEGEYVIRAV
jgi:nitrite reductase/ring-hydroxylating ferredoxin subunit